MIPLTEMSSSDRYGNEDGGLYGGGRNEPPPALRERASAAAARVRALDAAGRPDPEGTIAVLSIGMSNTSDEFRAFRRLASADPRVSPRVALIDGAQHARDSADWADDARGAGEAWATVERRVAAAGCTRAQVQAAWIKHARRDPAAIGKYPAHADALRADLEAILARLVAAFPSVRLAFLSSRVWGGHGRGRTNPEPAAYESAFAVRRLVLDHVREEAPDAPALLWGPYLWADGDRPRADGLAWRREDFRRDGMHPSARGRSKVAEALLEFFATDPAARPWFTR